MSTSSEPEYRLPLPTPAQAKSLAERIEAAVSPVIATSIAALAHANASANAATIGSAADAVIEKFTFASAPHGNGVPDTDRFRIYDAYFALNRLPDTAPKERAMQALTVALAVVIKDVAKAEAEKRGVTPIEFGILRQSLAAVIEILSETQTNNQ